MTHSHHALSPLLLALEVAAIVSSASPESARASESRRRQEQGLAVGWGPGCLCLEKLGLLRPGKA